MILLSTYGYQGMKQSEALEKIRYQRPFGARDHDGIWEISIKEYVPLVCVALHDGSAFPSELEQHCLLTTEERIFEEDPHTAKLVTAQSIVVSGLDSRYYYDLNRPPEHSDQITVFGRRVWKNDVHHLSSLAKQRHERFYELVKELIGKLVELYGFCLIIDVHSYNYSRIDHETPLFNLGTTELKREDEHLFVQRWKQELADVKFPGVQLPVAENDVFLGKGYFLQWVQKEFPLTCVTIPVDIKKIYCDEVTGVVYPLQFRRVARELNKAILFASGYFQEGCLPRAL